MNILHFFKKPLKFFLRLPLHECIHGQIYRHIGKITIHIGFLHHRVNHKTNSYLINKNKNKLLNTVDYSKNSWNVTSAGVMCTVIVYFGYLANMFLYFVKSMSHSGPKFNLNWIKFLFSLNQL